MAPETKKYVAEMQRELITPAGIKELWAVINPEGDACAFGSQVFCQDAAVRFNAGNVLPIN